MHKWDMSTWPLATSYNYIKVRNAFINAQYNVATEVRFKNGSGLAVLRCEGLPQTDASQFCVMVVAECGSVLGYAGDYDAEDVARLTEELYYHGVAWLDHWNLIRPEWVYED